MRLRVKDNETVLKSSVLSRILSDKTVPPHMGESRCDFGLSPPICGALADHNESLYFELFGN